MQMLAAPSDDLPDGRYSAGEIAFPPLQEMRNLQAQSCSARTLPASSASVSVRHI
jgi:hypothetical protein